MSIILSTTVVVGGLSSLRLLPFAFAVKLLLVVGLFCLAAEFE